MSVRLNHQVRQHHSHEQQHQQQGPTAMAEWIIFTVAASFGVTLFFLVVFASGLI